MENSQTGINALIQAGKKEAEKIQEIKTVVEPIQKQLDQNELSCMEDAGNTEVPITEPEKDILWIFNKKEIKTTEVTRIPADHHRELKILATLADCPMGNIICNILEDFFTRNEEELSNYKRKELL